MSKRVLLVTITVISFSYLFFKIRFPNVNDLYSNGIVYHKWTSLPFSGTLIDETQVDKSIVKYKNGRPHDSFDYYVQDDLFAWGRYIEAPEFEFKCSEKLGIEYLAISNYSDEFQPKSDSCLRNLQIIIVLTDSLLAHNDYDEMSKTICSYIDLIKLRGIKSTRITFHDSFYSHVPIYYFDCSSP